MTGTQNEIRSDTTSNILAYGALAQGELGFDVTRKALVVGDGTSVGGLCVSPFQPTWTPQLQFGGANVGMAGTFAGTCMQVGPFVIASALITLTAKGSSTGAATISGLPVPCGALAGSASVGSFSNLNTSPTLIGSVEETASFIVLQKSGGTSAANIVDTDFTNTTALIVTAIYLAAQPTG